MTAENKSWVVSFWADDHNKQQLYWSNANAFSLANPVPASKGVDNSAILIQLDKNGLPIVEWTAWT